MVITAIVQLLSVKLKFDDFGLFGHHLLKGIIIGWFDSRLRKYGKKTFI